MNTISVIIPAYNSQDTIREALDSIVLQGKYDFEIIVVDDGSSDGMKSKVDGFINTHPEVHVRYFYQKNKGVSAARNFGLKQAQGTFVAFLDSDDAWLSDKINQQLAVFRSHPEIALLGTNRDGVQHTTFFGTKIEPLHKLTPRLLLYKNYLMTSSILMKRDAAIQTGYFDETMSYSEDLEYFLRINNSFPCYLLNKNFVRSVTGKSGFGDSGLSANLWKMEKGELHNIKMAYKMKVVNLPEFIFIYLYSFLKYIRRIVISVLR